MTKKPTNILVTGGAGFIGSNFIHYVFSLEDFKGKIINLDKLTYAGNRENLTDIENKFNQTRYFFEHDDICNAEKVISLIKKHTIDTIVHFAAESHVDRSIHAPAEFIKTNIIGTYTLLEAIREKDIHFHHISTDEVYGTLEDDGFFFETSSYLPRSPYSATKASSDHIVRAYYHTYNVPITISNCSNNYGPYQFPEKLIPLIITNILSGEKLPVYGDGKNIRDWLYVDDHNSAVWLIINNGKIGETYNIGGENEWENIKLVNTLCEKLALKTNCSADYYKNLITFVKDRPGHDRRYAINCDKIKTELGWKQGYNFDFGLDKTIDWYLNNQNWISNVKSGEYKKWMAKNYNL